MRNEHGALVYGLPGSRVLVILDRRQLRGLADAEDVLLTSTAAVRRIVLATCRLGVEDAEASEVVYRSADVHVRPGFEGMLKCLCSGVAHEDDMAWLDYQGERVTPRRWAPMAGLRRRAYAAVRHVQKAHGLDDARMAQVLDQLRQASFR